MLRNLFYKVDRVFRPNDEADTNRKYPISQNNLGQGDGAWSTIKTVRGWDLNMISYLLRFPPRQQENVAAVIAAIPGEARTTSLLNWRKLLGLHLSITPDVLDQGSCSHS